jgi:hypothetical protein
MVLYSQLTVTYLLQMLSKFQSELPKLVPNSQLILQNIRNQQLQEFGELFDSILKESGLVCGDDSSVQDLINTESAMVCGYSYTSIYISYYHRSCITTSTHSNFLMGRRAIVYLFIGR